MHTPGQRSRRGAYEPGLVFPGFRQDGGAPVTEDFSTAFLSDVPSPQANLQASGGVVVQAKLLW